MFTLEIDPRFTAVLDITIDGQPKGKASVRVVGESSKKRRFGKYVVQTKGNRRGIQDTKSKAYEKKVAQLIRLHHTGPKIDGCAVVIIDSVKARPKKMHKSAIPVDAKHPEGRWYAPVKPDWDNIAKSVCDGIEKSGVLTNDSRVVVGNVTKMYAAEGERPSVSFVLYSSS